jgi:predicted transcriptional regulator
MVMSIAEAASSPSASLTEKLQHLRDEGFVPVKLSANHQSK